MKRINQTEWTDGKDIYVGNPKDGFVKKEVKQEPEEENVVDSGSITVFPVKPEEDE